MKIPIFYAKIAVGCSDKGFKSPKWSQTYTVKGVLNIPYAEISEPFYAW